MQVITITDMSGKKPVTIPANPSARREGDCVDLIVEMQVHIGCPVCVELSLRTDGTLEFWRTIPDGMANHYAHIVTGMYGHRFEEEEMIELPPPSPTEAQRTTVARWYLGHKPLGLAGTPGRTLLDWAFNGTGLTVQGINDMYGDGSTIYLAGEDAWLPAEWVALSA